MPRVILVLTDPPLPFGNAAARWYYVLVKGLVERGHSVTTLAACADPADVERARELFPAPAFDLRLFAPEARRGLLARLDSLWRPFSYQFSPAMRQALQAELARGCDVLHLEQLWGGWLADGAREKSLVTVLNLYAVDLADAPAPTWADRLRRAAVLGAERRLLRQMPHVSALTPRIAEFVRRVSPRSTVHVVPLAMDLGLYPFEPGDGPRDPAVGPLVSLIGSFGWQPTMSAARRLLERLWPEVRRRVPGARLQLVGRRARAALGEAVAGVPGVELHEDVPDTIPYFRASDVLLYAPGQGTGMKVKVLEAFALGTPVVTNADGVEGLPAVDGEHAGIADDDAGLVERTVALLEDAGLRRERRLRARALVEAHCSPGPVLDRLEAVHAAVRGR